LKVWILDTLDRNSEINCVSELAEENSLLVQVLDMLSHLVRFGYYDDIDDVNDVMVILIKLLDGTTDKPSPAIAASAVDLDEFKKKGRKLDNSENKSVFEVKCKALEVMNLFFRFKFYVKLQKFIHDFKVLYEVLQTGRKQEREETDPPQDLTPLIEADHEHPQDWIFSNRMISIVRDRIKFLCDGSSKGSGFAPSNNEISSLESVLLDLSEYECDELVTSSLDLLTQMYFFEEELFYKAHQGQLLTSPESLMDYQKVNDDILPKLRQLLRIDANKNNQKRIVEFLDTLSGMCILPFNNDSGVPTNRQNQIMLDNFGIVSEIVSYVLSQGSHEQSTTESSVAVGDNVFRACFCFLRHIATDNPTVQKRLFNRFDDLFEIKFPTLSLAALADLMTEVFTGGPELILRVTESHIETIFEMIVHSNDTSIQAHFMMALEAIAKIEEFDLPVSRNQHLIIKNFCRLRDSFCQELLGQSPESEQMRFDILKAEDTQAPDSQLQLLLGVVDMLAACAEGKNLFIESVCQNILSIDEVVTIISSEALLPQRKKPFVRFLLFVYLITEEDQQNNQGTALTHGEVMWTYLAHLSSILEGVARVLDTVPQGLIENIRNELSSAASRRKTFSAAKGEHRPLSTGGGPVMSRITSVNPVPGVTDENGVLYPDMLEYLADGIIPLLHTYYSFYFDPNSLSKVEERQAEFDISSDIAKSLVHLGKELVKVFSSKKHIEMYQETLNILLSYDKIRETANIHDQQTDALQATIATAPAPVRKLSSYRVRTLRASFDTDGNEATVIENYNKQEQLNDLFNNYSRNYHLSYMGPNTARHQIGSPVSDHIEYSDEGEELPLGPSFQNLVQLYVDYDTIVKDYVEGLLYQLETSSNKKGQLGEAEQVEQDILDVRCLQVNIICFFCTFIVLFNRF
jgi:inositol 1,4,5-triphosphate receptor type 1